MDRRPAIDVESYRYLAISGGAARGIALWSAVRTLQRLHPNFFGPALRGAGGTSIGSMLALAVVVGADSAMVMDLICDESMWSRQQLLSAINPIAFFATGTSNGLCTHEMIYRNIDRALDAMQVPREIHFAGLRERTGRDFVCNASCPWDGSSLYMRADTTPYLSLRQALCMSMCVPLIFPPVRYQGRDYYDGGLFDNLILGAFPPGEALGLGVDSQLNMARLRADPPRGGVACIGAMLGVLTSRIERDRELALDARSRASILRVYTPGVGANCFVADARTMRMLREFGEISVLWGLWAPRYVTWLICDCLRRHLRVAPDTAPGTDTAQNADAQGHALNQGTELLRASETSAASAEIVSNAASSVTNDAP